MDTVKEFLEIANLSGFVALAVGAIYLVLTKIENITKYVENLRFREEPHLREALESKLLPHETQEALKERFADIVFARTNRLSVRGRMHREAIIRLVEESKGIITYDDVRTSQYSMHFDISSGNFQAHMNRLERYTGIFFTCFFYLTVVVFVFSMTLAGIDYFNSFSISVNSMFTILSSLVLVFVMAKTTAIVKTSARIDDWLLHRRQADSQWKEKLQHKNDTEQSNEAVT